MATQELSGSRRRVALLSCDLDQAGHLRAVGSQTLLVEKHPRPIPPVPACERFFRPFSKIALATNGRGF